MPETMTTDTQATQTLPVETPTAESRIADAPRGTEPTIAACIHHWVLACPEDDVIRGRCKHCGEQREYPASVEGASRQGAFEEAAAIGKTAALLPDLGGGVAFLQNDERPY